jgi:hypothetical protein
MQVKGYLQYGLEVLRRSYTTEVRVKLQRDDWDDDERGLQDVGASSNRSARHRGDPPFEPAGGRRAGPS